MLRSGSRTRAYWSVQNSRWLQRGLRAKGHSANLVSSHPLRKISKSNEQTIESGIPYACSTTCAQPQLEWGAVEKIAKIDERTIESRNRPT